MESELAEKLEEWKLTLSGMMSRRTGAYINEPTMEQALKYAFIAGAQANEDIREEICIKLMTESK